MSEVCLYSSGEGIFKELEHGNSISLPLAPDTAWDQQSYFPLCTLFLPPGRRILATITICLRLTESYLLDNRSAGVKESQLGGAEAVAGCPWLYIAFGFLEFSPLVAQMQSKHVAQRQQFKKNV